MGSLENKTATLSSELLHRFSKNKYKKGLVATTMHCMYMSATRNTEKRRVKIHGDRVCSDGQQWETSPQQNQEQVRRNVYEAPQIRLPRCEARLGCFQ